MLYYRIKSGLVLLIYILRLGQTWMDCSRTSPISPGLCGLKSLLLSIMRDLALVTLAMLFWSINRFPCVHVKTS